MATAPAPPLPDLDFEGMSDEELLRWAHETFGAYTRRIYRLLGME